MLKCVEVNVPGSPSLTLVTVGTVSVDVKQHLKKKPSTLGGLLLAEEAALRGKSNLLFTVSCDLGVGQNPECASLRQRHKD